MCANAFLFCLFKIKMCHSHSFVILTWSSAVYGANFKNGKSENIREKSKEDCILNYVSIKIPFRLPIKLCFIHTAIEIVHIVRTKKIYDKCLSLYKRTEESIVVVTKR